MSWMTKPYWPIEIDDVLYAFPADVEFLMPAWEDIPDEYKNERHRLHGIVSNFIFTGQTSPTLRFSPRTDIDYQVSARHLSAVARSFQPKHQHKEAALTLLFDLWFPELGEPGESE